MNNLSFATLREINARRSNLWMRGVSWTRADWITALVGEVGEMANFSKKMNRIENGLVGNVKVEDTDLEELRQGFNKELGDIMLYLDLLADSVGVDLAEITVEVFNRKSEQLGFEERL